MKTYNTVVTSKEVKTLENVVARSPVEAAEGLEIVDYSEKAIAVFGETKAIKDELKKLGGKFNPALKYNSEKRAAFAKASKAFIQEWRANNPYPGSDHLDEFNAKFNRDYSEFANKYGVSSYMVPNPYPIERGEYKDTALDRQKKAADILVESIDGNWYTIRLNREIEIKSKRIRKYDNGCIAVPESMYYKLKDKYNVMCNF